MATYVDILYFLCYNSTDIAICSLSPLGGTVFTLTLVTGVVLGLINGVLGSLITNFLRVNRTFTVIFMILVPAVGTIILFPDTRGISLAATYFLVSCIGLALRRQ
jgi:hypothetical protein